MKNTVTWTNGNQKTLIDHCLITNVTTIIEQLFGFDHFTLVSLSLLKTDYENNKTQFCQRDTRKFSRASLNKKNCISGLESHVSTKQCKLNF